MKTMLKTKLSQVSLWSQGLLLVVTPAGFATAVQSNDPNDGHSQEQMQLSKDASSTDTVILMGSDSQQLELNNLSDSLAAVAPKIQLNPAAVKFVKSYIRRNNED